MLLGCEASGNGRPIQVDGAGVHVITTLDSVIIRYLFFLPAYEMKEFAPTSAVQRKHIKLGITDAFKKIQAGKPAGRL